MANTYTTLGSLFTAIANAIRAKKGTSGQIIADTFPDEIASIQTQPNLQSKTVTPSTFQQTVTPDSGYDGLSSVQVNGMPSGVLNAPSVDSGGLVTASVGTSGYLPANTRKTTQLSTQSGMTITPTTYQQTAVPSGRYTTGNVYVAGDADLVPSNIKSGVSIFGVSGTAPNPSGTLSIYSNGICDVRDYQYASVDVGWGIDWISPYDAEVTMSNNYITIKLYFDGTIGSVIGISPVRINGSQGRWTITQVMAWGLPRGSYTSQNGVYIVYEDGDQGEIRGYVSQYSDYIRIRIHINDIDWIDEGYCGINDTRIYYIS